MNKFEQAEFRNSEKRLPDPNAFLLLPEEDVEQIGTQTHMGPRLEAAILASFAYHYKRNYYRETEITYHNGIRVTVPKGRFIVSIQTIAEDLYFRWFLNLPEGEDYKRFYERVKKSVGRLKDKGLLTYHGYAHPKSRGLFGSFWSLENTKIGKEIASLPECAFSGLVVTQAVEKEYKSDGLINVVDLIGSDLMRGSHSDFHLSEMCTSIYDRNRFHDYMDWQTTIARKGAKGGRHTSIGAFRKSDLVAINTAPCTVPFIIIDLDENSVETNFDTARSITQKLKKLGCDIRQIIVAYTGGKGFHIQIPSGLIGNPIYQHSYSAAQIIGEFVDKIIPKETVDRQKFYPTALIRVIGSMHEASGKYKYAQNGNDFLRSSLEGILKISRQFVGYTLVDPTSVNISSTVIGHFFDSIENASHSTPSFRSGTKEFVPPAFKDVQEFNQEEYEPKENVYTLAMKGVSEGEVWCKEKGYQGRSMAMFVAACSLINKCADEQTAWDKLVEVNNRNSPPLPLYRGKPGEDSLIGRFRSAQRKVSGKYTRKGWIT